VFAKLFYSNYIKDIKKELFDEWLIVC
jgi:hypothetical protein